MRGTALYGPRDVRFEDRAEPPIEKPTDVVIRMAATWLMRTGRCIHWRPRSVRLALFDIGASSPKGHGAIGEQRNHDISREL